MINNKILILLLIIFLIFFIILFFKKKESFIKKKKKKKKKKGSKLTSVGGKTSSLSSDKFILRDLNKELDIMAYGNRDNNYSWFDEEMINNNISSIETALATFEPDPVASNIVPDDPPESS